MNEATQDLPGTQPDQPVNRMIIYCEPITHLGRKWVRLDIGDDIPVAEIKTRLPSLHWRAGAHQGLMPWRDNWLQFLQTKLEGLAEVTDSPPPSRRAKRLADGPRTDGRKRRRSSSQSPALPPEYLEQLRHREYSEATIRVYVSHFNLLLAHTGHRPPQDLGPAEIKAYLEYLSGEKGVSGSYRNQAMSAIKFYFEQVLTPAREI